jgi:hypothetical protein
VKVHLRDLETLAVDWKQSPHIERAINEGLFTICGQIVPKSNITEEEDDATCKACSMPDVFNR